MNNCKLVRIITLGVALTLSMGANAQMHVDAAGKVGIGTLTPGQSLHVVRNDGSARILVEELNAVKGPRALFEIKNNGNPEFKMTNTGNGNSWSFSAGQRFVVKNNTGAWVSRLTSTGDFIITGSITTTGGTCGGGCDLVFDPDTPLESIEEHADQMWSNSYLPAVGPTIENAPINLSEKTGGMLNELEKAHIYIEQLHKRLAGVESNLASVTPKMVGLAAEVKQLQSENQALKDTQAEIFVLQKQQQGDFEKLRSMLVDLQTQTQSQTVLASLK